jgi:hypothetical protein
VLSVDGRKRETSHDSVRMYVDCEFFSAVRGIHVCKVCQNVRTRCACDLFVWEPGLLLLALSVPYV